MVIKIHDLAKTRGCHCPGPSHVCGAHDLGHARRWCPACSGRVGVGGRAASRRSN